jgi:DNA ligase-1
MEKQIKYFEKGGDWFISRKLDGVRCLCFIRNRPIDPVVFYSREGNRFMTLGKIEEEIKKHVIPHLKTDIVIDGEVCLIENDVESFSGIMKMIKKLNYTIENPKYIIFDLLTINEFENKSSNRILSERFNVCGRIIKKAGKMETIRLLNQYTYTQEKFDEMSEYVVNEGWEGLMVRKDENYEGKRTKNLLKVKKFHREEYTVVGMEVGKVSNNGGKHSNEIGLKSASIKHKDCLVEVGSGFSDKERIHYYNNQTEIVGKVISVQFFEETVTTKKGKDYYSLRFPTFKGLYGKSRDI